MVERRTSRALGVLAASVFLACASAPLRPAPAPATPSGAAADGSVAAPPGSDTGGLSFAVAPADAEVLIDGRSYGKVADLARNGTLPLPAGLYQVSLRCPGYATWRAEVAVRGAVEPIRVNLTPRPAKP
jgi:hypothetical protein